MTDIYITKVEKDVHYGIERFSDEKLTQLSAGLKLPPQVDIYISDVSSPELQETIKGKENCRIINSQLFYALTQREQEYLLGMELFLCSKVGGSHHNGSGYVHSQNYSFMIEGISLSALFVAANLGNSETFSQIALAGVIGSALGVITSEYLHEKRYSLEFNADTHAINATNDLEAGISMTRKMCQLYTIELPKYRLLKLEHLWEQQNPGQKLTPATGRA